MKRKSAFDRCVESVSKGSADDPRAVCAVAGRRKYGQAEMTRRAIAGKRRKQNPIEESAELVEAFLGRPAESVREVVDEIHVHSVLPDFGELLGLWIALDGDYFDRSRKPDLKHCIHIEYEGVTLGFSERKVWDTGLNAEVWKQAYMVGGDQSLDLGHFPDVDPLQEGVEIGPIAFIEYQTAKNHLGKADKKPGPYIHAFSEESKGKLPKLCYDTINQQGSFIGGSYYIMKDMDGKYSAGIRD